MDEKTIEFASVDCLKRSFLFKDIFVAKFLRAGFCAAAIIFRQITINDLMTLMGEVVRHGPEVTPNYSGAGNEHPSFCRAGMGLGPERNPYKRRPILEKTDWLQ